MTEGDPSTGFDIKSNLRQVLADLKEFDPKLAAAVRKELRGIGDEAIKAMGDILDQESGGTLVNRRSGFLSAKKLRLTEANRSRSTGARDEIKSGLRVRVSTGKARTTVRLAATKGDLRKAMNKKAWRHPVFGNREAWVNQPGNRYFNRGAYEGAKDMRERLEAAVKVALDAIVTHNTTTE